MTLDQKQLAHVIHYCPAVYFVLSERPTEAEFLAVLEVLRSRSDRAEVEYAPKDHWAGLQSRLAGKSRWDSLVARYDGPLKTADDYRKRDLTLQTVDGILARRPYVGYLVEGIRYTVDVFNPANEFEMPYAGAGASVIALILQSADAPAVGPGRIRDRLVENRVFYDVVKDVAGILRPESVCGTEPNTMFSMLWAYLEDRVDPAYSPWEFLYQLQVIDHPRIALTPETRIGGEAVGMMPGKAVKLAKVEDWGADRVLIQVRPGLEGNISWEYFAVAKALGMVPVQQLVEGKAPPHPSRAKERTKRRTKATDTTS